MRVSAHLVGGCLWSDAVLETDARDAKSILRAHVGRELVVSAAQVSARRHARLRSFATS
jgi:hypothetical protein